MSDRAQPRPAHPAMARADLTLLAEVQDIVADALRETSDRDVTDLVARTFRAVWPEVRRATVTDHRVLPSTLSQITDLVITLMAEGMSTDALLRVTRALAESAFRQVMHLRLSASRTAQVTQYTALTMHDLVAAVLSFSGGIGDAAPLAAADQPEASELEREILQRLASGQSSSEIADELHYSRQAVSYHLSRLLSKYRVPNRTALVAFAYENGLLPFGAGWRLKAS